MAPTLPWSQHNPHISYKGAWARAPLSHQEAGDRAAGADGGGAICRGASDGQISVPLQWVFRFSVLGACE